MLEGIITAEEVAEMIGVSSRTVRRWAARGYLPRHRLAGRWRFRRSEIERWYAEARGDGSWPEVQDVSATG